ncbi:Crp/Fnr family transcriptional regulator [Variovorax boronicumulans]|uniref:Crp/Fnr family transcriptional regulator n=1 Tax=Variovorax boronicumulans TaxID=436515 RepID=UPI00085C1F0C|nr:Crp/Fnr family transcriptional regulator [Variovorax boronicumulans]OEZ31340.1 Crp/Fnr family transcriptional regulator [Variovorax boronicumulans]
MSNALENMLRESLWARALTDDELDRVVQESHERVVPAGGFVVRRGEPADHWIGVIDGLMKMSVSLPDGRVSTFTGVTAGGWGGEGSLLTPGCWRYDGVALRPTRVACVPRHSFERLMSTSIDFNRFLLLHINARLSLFIGLMEFDRLLGPDARVARCLASLFDPILYPRATRFVRLSQDEIGLLSAVSRQRANRALHALQRDGLLRIEHGGVEVLDLAGLRTYQSGAAEAAAVVAAATDTQAAAPLDDLVSPPSPRWP